MNKRPFLILSLFLLLFSFDGQAADTYRPEISVAGFIPLPDCGRQVYNFNPGWRFFKGDIRGAEANPGARQDKTLADRRRCQSDIRRR